MWLLPVLTTATIATGIPAVCESSEDQFTVSASAVWSAVAATGCVGPTTKVEIATEATLTVDADMDLGMLTVRGQLQWDTAVSGLTLRAGGVHVTGAGALFRIGSEGSPMLLPATIYLDATRASADLVNDRTARAIIGSGGATVSIHGKKVGRTWSELAATARVGDTSLAVAGDLVAAGWAVGDRIAVAPTQHVATGRGETFSVTGISTTAATTATTTPLNMVSGVVTVLQLDGVVAEDKLGKTSVIGGKRVTLAAEVLLLSRNVVVTGSEFVNGPNPHGGPNVPQGLHVRQEGSGRMEISYARVERCGQHGILGRYCLHFHLLGDRCPTCTFVGNAVEHGAQRGIVVHGSHRTTVRDNVVYDVKGGNLYVEDGNERRNLFEGNAAVCPYPWGEGGCAISGTDNEQADDLQQSGIWALSADNDFINNRAANHRNGFFLQSTAFGNGRGNAELQVKPMHTRFGIIKGNVFHSNQRFGFYPDSNWPRNVEYDPDTDHVVPESTVAFLGPAGLDNGQSPGAVVEDGLDWHNDLMGQYAMGDVQFLNHVSVNNNVNLYWKTTKNFVDQVTSHVKGCIFATSASYVENLGGHFVGAPHCLVKGPGDHGTFLIEDTQFIATEGVMAAALCAGQHCGLGGAGSLCAATYHLENVDFSGVATSVGTHSTYLQHGISTAPGRSDHFAFSAFDGSLGGNNAVVTAAMTHLTEDPSCGAPIVPVSGGASIGCNRQVRRLYVWSADIGEATITSSSTGGTYTIQHESANGGQGYAVPVFVGETYTLSFSNELNYGADDYPVAFEFSDQVFGTRFNPGVPETIELAVQTPTKMHTCTLSSLDSRAWINYEGPQHRGSGSCAAMMPDAPAPPETVPLAGCTAENLKVAQCGSTASILCVRGSDGSVHGGCFSTRPDSSFCQLSCDTALGPPPEVTCSSSQTGVCRPQRHHGRRPLSAPAATLPTPASPAPTPAPVGEDPCLAVWDTLAGDYTCGARISYLVDSEGQSDAEARNRVAAEHPTVCGSCSVAEEEDLCLAVWDMLAGDYTCGARISYLVDSEGQSDTEARNRVAAEHPAVCGSCSSTDVSAKPMCPTSLESDRFRIEGSRIFLDNELLYIKGVCWNPVPRGQTHPPTEQNLLDYAAIDGPLMQAAGITAVRTYVTITSLAVLDELQRHNISVVNAIDPSLDTVSLSGQVSALKGHPGILMWSLGNEWNYNGLYQSLSFDTVVARIAAASETIRAVDPTRPIMTVYGEVPSQATVEALPCVDTWALNIYSSDDFGDRFSSWALVSTNKPAFLGEYGADAFNALPGVNGYDPESQGHATTKLGGQIVAASTVRGGVLSGGFIFEWADEWWKASGKWEEQDAGGIAPGGGPFPDLTFNEEYWGLVDIDRNPRAAYTAYQNLPLP